MPSMDQIDVCVRQFQAAVETATRTRASTEAKLLRIIGSAQTFLFEKTGEFVQLPGLHQPPALHQPPSAAEDDAHVPPPADVVDALGQGHEPVVDGHFVHHPAVENTDPNLLPPAVNVLAVVSAADPAHDAVSADVDVDVLAVESQHVDLLLPAVDNKSEDDKSEDGL
jgi:hypothetical protein